MEAASQVALAKFLCQTNKIANLDPKSRNFELHNSPTLHI